MDFSFGDEHRALRDTVRRFCLAEIAPRARARAADDSETFPRAIFKLHGDEGDDLLVGGAGVDTYVCALGDDHDVIHDEPACRSSATAMFSTSAPGMAAAPARWGLIL